METERAKLKQLDTTCWQQKCKLQSNCPCPSSNSWNNLLDAEKLWNTCIWS